MIQNRVITDQRDQVRPNLMKLQNRSPHLRRKMMRMKMKEIKLMKTNVMTASVSTFSFIELNRGSADFFEEMSGANGDDHTLSPSSDTKSRVPPKFNCNCSTKYEQQSYLI